MNRSILSRTAALLALVALPALALAPPPASADEPGAITLTGTFHMSYFAEPVGADLAAVFANANENTWTLTMHDTAYSRSAPSEGWRLTRISSSSIELQFSGPDETVLNEVVGGPMAGGTASLELWNA